jgi:PadR family transcriptional regulator, regulatory protein PadR
MKLLSRIEEILLVAVWRLTDNAYGVSIRDEMSRLTGRDWTLGAVYVPLDKLTRKGLLSKETSDPTPERGGRSKCLYRLSTKGRDSLKEIREVSRAIWEGIPDAALD